MKSKELQEIFNNIPVSRKKGLFYIKKRSSNLFLTKTQTRNAALGLTFDQPQSNTGDSVFEGIGIRFFREGEVVFKGKKTECSFLIIENLDSENRERFYDLVKDVSDEIDYDRHRFINIYEIVSYLISWAALFRKQSLLKNSDTIGLFGELYFILKSGHPKTLLKRWHSPENSKYDFSYGRNLLDVKTSTVGKEHHFELEQVSPCKVYKKYIASVTLKVSELKGESIAQLIKELSDNVSKKQLSHLITKRSKNIKLCGVKYQVTSLNIYDAMDIPQPVKTSEYISDINFVSNLTTIKNDLPLKKIVSLFL